MTNDKSWVDMFSRTGAHVLAGLIVGMTGLIIAALDIPIGREAMATGFTWAARSMWGTTPVQDNSDPKPVDKNNPLTPSVSVYDI